MVVIIRIIYKHTCYTVEYCIISRNMIIYMYMYIGFYSILYISYHIIIHIYIYIILHYIVQWYLTLHDIELHHMHHIKWYDITSSYIVMLHYTISYKIINHTLYHWIKKPVVIWYIYTYHISYIKYQKSYNTIYTHHIYIY